MQRYNKTLTQEVLKNIKSSSPISYFAFWGGYCINGWVFFSLGQGRIVQGNWGGERE